MADAVPPPDGKASKPLRKSFFKKPSWQKSEVKPDSASDDATEFFSRRSNFSDVIAEQEIRRKEKITKQLEDAEKRKSAETDDFAIRDGKKRRISEGSEGSSEEPCSPGEGGGKNRHDRKLKPNRNTSSPQSHRSQIIQKSPSKRHHRNDREDETITVGSDPDFDQDLYHTSSRRRQGQSKNESPMKESIEEGDFREDHGLGTLEAKLREWKKQRELEAQKNLVVPSTAIASTDVNSATSSKPDDASNLAVQVLVTSEIPTTQPVLFKMYLTQRLGEVKSTWCKYCKVSDTLASSIFLTHNMKRIYDVTTAKALGVTPDNVKELGNLHLVAVTAELFQQMKDKAAAEIELVASRGEEEVEHIEDAESPVPKPQVKTIKIVLKVKGHEDFKLEVKPETTFGKISSAFRTKYRIAKDNKVMLIFDGDELDPNMEMQNSEVEDMDVIEVHIN